MRKLFRLIILLGLTVLATPAAAVPAQAGVACERQHCSFLPLMLIPPSLTFVGYPQTTYVDPAGMQYVIGEIVNRSSNTFTHIQTALRLWNFGGPTNLFVDSQVKLTHLGPYQTTCVETRYIVPEDFRGAGLYETTPITAEATMPLSPSLTLQNVTARSDNTGYHIQGSIENTNVDAVANIQVVATLYDRNQRPIGCETLPIELTIAGGATEPFSLTLSGQRWLAVTTYKLQLDQTANVIHS